MIRGFNGKTPKIHPTAFVSEFAYVVGDVEIGEYSNVWPGTIIRANNHKITLARYVNIQDRCVIHSDSDAYYGDYAVLGHGVTCHAKTVGAYTLIGNQAVINGEAIIGEHSVVASGAVVLERAEVPAKSFVIGVPPNQEIRSANERQQGMAERTATGYAQNGQRFKADGLGDPDAEKFYTEVKE